MLLSNHPSLQRAQKPRQGLVTKMYSLTLFQHKDKAMLEKHQFDESLVSTDIAIPRKPYIRAGEGLFSMGDLPVFYLRECGLKGLQFQLIPLLDRPSAATAEGVRSRSSHSLPRNSQL